jgi:transcriptional regulator with XRE-family HTH domain
MSMTTTIERPTVPTFDLADRLRKALREANERDGGDLSVEELAEELGYSRQSVGNWMANRTVPRRAVILQWAFRTGVDPHWLETGEVPHGPDREPEQATDGSGCLSGTAGDELEADGLSTVIPLLRAG